MKWKPRYLKWFSKYISPNKYVRIINFSHEMPLMEISYLSCVLRNFTKHGGGKSEGGILK